jgi:hypothetical protein
MRDEGLRDEGLRDERLRDEGLTGKMWGKVTTLGGLWRWITEDNGRASAQTGR